MRIHILIMSTIWKYVHASSLLTYFLVPLPQIEKKPYFPLFKLAGFVGFDGDFK